jgi:hypothetical protein
MGRLIIEGSSVYEVDEECLKRRKVPKGCRVLEALERQKDTTEKKPTADNKDRK